MDKRKIVTLLILLPLLFLCLLNLLTVFTPEIGFDALWYHLTLPKLWLLKRQWHFDGGLLYYSVMPRLTETLYIPLIKFTGFVGPKLLQYLAGIGVCILIWKISKNIKLPNIYRLLAISLFYCTWLVSWESGSAYIDLIRTFLETIALYFFVSNSWKKAGIFLGLAIGTKWIALGSLVIYALVFNPFVVIPAILISLPWFAIALYFTGNPIFPIFSSVIHNTFLPFDQIISRIIFSPYFLIKPFDDFLSPLIGLVLIFSFVSFFKVQTTRKIALVGVLGTLLSLLIDPPSSRFALPYLPALTISATYLFFLSYDRYKNILIAFVVLSSFIIISMRLVAIQKYIPFLLGREDTRSFLTRYSSRIPDTFVDSDRFVEKEIPADSKILVDRIHNLYYFDRDFDHTSWVSDWHGYDYLVTIGEDPTKIGGVLIHTNPIGIQVFKLNK